MPDAPAPPDAASPASRVARPAALVVLGGFVCQLALGYGHTYGHVLNDITAELGWTRAEFSFVRVPQMIMMSVASPIAGIALARLGARPILVGSVACLLASQWILSEMGSLAAFGTAAALQGLVAVGLGDVVVGAIVARWVTRARGLALGLSAALVGGLGAGVYYFAGASGMQPGDVSSGPAPRDVDDEALARVDLPPVEPLEPVAPALEIPVASVDELPRLDDVPPLALKPVDDKRAKRARKRFDEGGELLAAGELEAAINTYVAGLKEDPGNVDMRYNLACAYVLSGAPVRGLALLREFKEVGCAFCVGRLIRAREDNDWRAIWGHPVFEALTADAAVEVTEFTESAQALVAALVETGDPSSVERLFHPRRAATVSIEHDGCTPDSGHRCVERERLGGTSAIAAWLVARHEAHRDGSAPLSVGRLLACDEEHCCEFDGPTIERPGTLYLDELCFEVDSGSVPYLERVALHDLEA
ncbi:MAG: hypothetical protein KC636_11665 [Myxococcales bacterium]|nr:hypothetical protein [Myxococcales bacterium]